jgi:hypothetical protein
MPNALIVGDSQAGNPGAAAKAALEARGFTVVQIHNDGKSPIAYVNTPELMNQYVGAAAGKDIVVLIFGHNSNAGSATRNALIRMRDAVRAPVMMSGPPMYPNASDQAIGTALRDQNMRIFGDRYIDAWPSTPVTLPRDTPGWHLTRAAAQGWGQAIADAVVRALAPGGAATRPFGVSPMAIATAVLGTAAVGVIAALLWQRRRA